MERNTKVENEEDVVELSDFYVLDLKANNKWLGRITLFLVSLCGIGLLALGFR